MVGSRRAAVARELEPRPVTRTVPQDTANSVSGYGRTISLVDVTGDHGGFRLYRTVFQHRQPEQLRRFDANDDGQLDLLGSGSSPDPRDAVLLPTSGPNCPLFLPDGG